VLTVREKIIAGTRPRHQAYTLLSGVPVKDYKAEIFIEGRSNGCIVTWTATFSSRIPALGKPLQLALRAGVWRAAAALAREAERRK
jgi:hypothetical protein